VGSATVVESVLPARRLLDAADALDRGRGIRTENYKLCGQELGGVRAGRVQLEYKRLGAVRVPHREPDHLGFVDVLHVDPVAESAGIPMLQTASGR